MLARTTLDSDDHLTFSFPFFLFLPFFLCGSWQFFPIGKSLRRETFGLVASPMCVISNPREDRPGQLVVLPRSLRILKGKLLFMAKIRPIFAFYFSFFSSVEQLSMDKYTKIYRLS